MLSILWRSLLAFKDRYETADWYERINCGIEKYMN